MALGHRVAEAYPRTPEGWTVVSRRSAGPFTTYVSYRRPDGSTAEWSSRAQRKSASRLSRARRNESVWWAPHRASWWIGVLFAIGSACFFLGPFPGVVNLIGTPDDAKLFFIGSIFFTSAALLQFLEAANADREPEGGRGRLRLFTWEPGRIDWCATLIQLIGTIFFNIDTYRAMQSLSGTHELNRLVWTPEALGSICFLISGALAYMEVRDGGLFAGHRHPYAWRIAGINLLGCLLFGASTIAGFIVPATGDFVDLAAANLTTSLGGLCFLIGALMLLPEGAADAEPAPPAAATA